MSEGVKRALAAACDIMLPRVCLVCGGRLLAAEKHICLKCTADMPLTRFWEQGHNPMSDRFNEVIQKDLDSGTSVRREKYAQAAALFFFKEEAGYRHIPYSIKYQGNIPAAAYFGRMLGKRLAGSGIWNDADLIIPVPLHWTRRWKRGYNQAEVTAGAIAETMQVPMRTDILKRRKRTLTQTRLDIEGKASNVADAFEVTDDALMIFRNGGNIRHIILVDDVFTSGSTAASCLKALRKAFPAPIKISAVTLGFVGD